MFSLVRLTAGLQTIAKGLSAFDKQVTKSGRLYTSGRPASRSQP